MAVIEEFDTVVIGGGQAGLAAGYHLGRRDVRFVILDAGAQVGDSWRTRWDSLRLFTPAAFNGLPGTSFPGGPRDFPTKDEVAAFLGDYARTHGLPVRSGVRVDRLAREGDRFTVQHGDTAYRAQRVIVATGTWQAPRRPAEAAQLEPTIRQLHSGDYRRPSQLADGPVLVVGAGTSGAELALEAARAGHRVTMVGPDVGRVPPIAYAFDGAIFRFLLHHVLTIDTPIGRRAAVAASRGGPWIRITSAEVAAAGIRRLSGHVSVRDGRPVTADGQPLEASTVLWCTGFRSDWSWIDLPISGPGRALRARRGLITDLPGLGFVGLPFQTGMASGLLEGVGRDARLVVDALLSPPRTAA